LCGRLKLAESLFPRQKDQGLRTEGRGESKRAHSARERAAHPGVQKERKKKYYHKNGTGRRRLWTPEEELFIQVPGFTVLQKAYALDRSYHSVDKKMVDTRGKFTPKKIRSEFDRVAAHFRAD